jgi:hypothetical protein
MPDSIVDSYRMPQPKKTAMPSKNKPSWRLDAEVMTALGIGLDENTRKKARQFAVEVTRMWWGRFQGMGITSGEDAKLVRFLEVCDAMEESMKPPATGPGSGGS